MGHPCCDLFARVDLLSRPDVRTDPVEPPVAGAEPGDARPADTPSPSAGRTWRRPTAAGMMGYAAGPVFLLMAAATAAGEDAALAAICGAGPLPFASDMVAMYLLMGVFHLGPWLEMARRRG